MNNSVDNETKREREPSDEYNKKLQRDLGLVRAYTKSTIGLITVIGMFFLLVNQTPLPSEAWYAIIAILAGSFGLDGLLSIFQHKNGGN